MESEILALIDALEELINAGGRVPLSTRVMVSSGDILALLDQMRQSLPREIVRARHIYQERDRMLEDARREATALRQTAQAEREALLAEHNITVEARRQAEKLKREARAECERMRHDAETYALHHLRDLQVQMTKTRAALDATLKTVVNGIAHLESQPPEPEAESPDSPEAHMPRKIMLKAS